MKCLWCQTPIKELLTDYPKKDPIPHQACDRDCAHGLHVIREIDAILKLELSPIVLPENLPKQRDIDAEVNAILEELK